MDPAEVTLRRARPRPGSRTRKRGAAVVLRPRDWAGAYRETVEGVVAELAAGLPPARDRLPRVTTDTPFGVVLRGGLAGLPARHDRLPPSMGAGRAGGGGPCRSFSIWSQRREPPTVVFPAVRYLVATTQEHQRRLRLQNWLLLLLRTLLIIALVLAAAGPTRRRGARVPSHAASALVADSGQQRQQRRGRRRARRVWRGSGTPRAGCSPARRRRMRSGW